MTTALYPSDYTYQNDTKKMAVILRYNQIREEQSKKGVDWGYLFAELVAAYNESA